MRLSLFVTANICCAAVIRMTGICLAGYCSTTAGACFSADTAAKASASAIAAMTARAGILNIAGMICAGEAVAAMTAVPAVAKGLCGAVYTQLADVEDETNGLLSYDRRVCKVDTAAMRQLAEKLTIKTKQEEPLWSSTSYCGH